ncbi:MAG: SPOR domain-containing protein [Brevinematia bacterium]
MKRLFVFSVFILSWIYLFSQTEPLNVNIKLTNVVEITNEVVVTNEIIDINYVDETNYITNYVVITNIVFSTRTENYILQAGVFLNRRFADNLIKRLKRKNFDAYLKETYPYYKVFVGRNLSKKDAETILRKLKGRSFSAILRKDME